MAMDQGSTSTVYEAGPRDTAHHPLTAWGGITVTTTNLFALCLFQQLSQRRYLPARPPGAQKQAQIVYVARLFYFYNDGNDVTVEVL